MMPDDIGSIVLLTGTDKAALLRALNANSNQVSAVVLPHTSKREYRLQSTIDVAHEHNIEVARPKRTELTARLRQLAPDVLISAGYPYILTSEHLGVAKHNLNVHPTLLPKFRGPATAWHVIAHGQRESGVTVHLIDEGVDAGPIVAQQTLELTPFDTVASLMRKTSELEPQIVMRALQAIASGDAPQPQDESRASTFMEIRTAADSQIDPTRSLGELYDFIRACDPERFPAFFEVDGQAVGIKLFRLNKPAHEQDLI